MQTCMQIRFNNPVRKCANVANSGVSVRRVVDSLLATEQGNLTEGLTNWNQFSNSVVF